MLFRIIKSNQMNPFIGIGSNKKTDDITSSSTRYNQLLIIPEYNLFLMDF